MSNDNCENFKSVMSEFIQDKLSDNESKRVRGHIASCDECRHEAEELRRTLEIISTFETSPSPDFVERTTARVAAAATARSAKAKPRKKTAAAKPSFGSWFVGLFRKPQLAASIALHVLLLAAISLLIYMPASKRTPPKKVKPANFAQYRFEARQLYSSINRDSKTLAVKGFLEDGAVTLFADKGKRFFSVFTAKEWKGSPESRLKHALVENASVESGRLVVPPAFIAVCNINPADVVLLDVRGKNIIRRVEVWDGLAFRDYEEKLYEEREIKINVHPGVILP